MKTLPRQPRGPRRLLRGNYPDEPMRRSWTRRPHGKAHPPSRIASLEKPRTAKMGISSLASWSENTKGPQTAVISRRGAKTPTARLEKRAQHPFPPRLSPQHASPASPCGRIRNPSKAACRRSGKRWKTWRGRRDIEGAAPKFFRLFRLHGRTGENQMRKWYRLRCPRHARRKPGESLLSQHVRGQRR